MIKLPNALLALNHRGQSVWLDQVSRGLITSGGLQRLVEQDGISGVTSNPTIFAKAVSGSADYDDSIADMVRRQPDITHAALAERLMIEDIQMAADVVGHALAQGYGS